MKRTNTFITLLFIVLAISCAEKKEPLPELTYSGEEPRVQNPLPPEDSRKHIQVPDGFEVVLFASEPNIINPIAFTWDKKGRLWVVQSQDYPHGLSNDVGGDRITICEDTNNDGKADKFTDFATQQSLSTGIVKVKGGIIVAQAPDMVFLEDTNGDDKMDKKTVLFGGFGTWDTHAGPANLKYGTDNKIWGSVGYSGFENTFKNKTISFKMGVFRFTRDGEYFEPVGQFNNNTWGLGFNENFEVFGSTANNNHCCYVGIPLKHYEYLKKKPHWAINSDFIQGHYEITPADSVLPLQQVDVRGGYTAVAGANFYTAKNYPEAYQNHMYVNEPTGHLVHIAKIVQDGAGYKEEDGGNIFASRDAWTAPVFSETGPDGNLWVADWYNPVIQHNPDKRGMENQIWNDDKGEGNAHKNELRDKGHGRIYIIKHEDGDDSEITEIDVNNNDDLIEGITSDNSFWRTTAQRLIVEHQKTELIPELIKLTEKAITSKRPEINTNGIHTLWTLKGLGALDDPNSDASQLILKGLESNSYGLKRAALALLPNSELGSKHLGESGLLYDSDLQVRLAAILRAGELPETDAIYNAIAKLAEDPVNQSDKWLKAAIKIYYKELNKSEVDPKTVTMVIPSAEEEPTIWKYTETKPGDDWFSENYNDTSWKQGPSMFGGDKTASAKTKWSKEDIWMRRTVTLEEAISNPALKVSHDDNYEVYVNGKLLYEESGVSKPYKYINLEASLKNLFKKGKNLIAVHCHDTGGERYIDVGIGNIGKFKADVVFNLNTVSQKMAFDKTILHAKVGQTVEIVLNNKDEMPHNLVVIEAGSLERFGNMVDDFLKDPDAAKSGYVPNSRYVLGATKMLEPGTSDAFIFKLPNKPGRYPFVCTFPGHWQMMKGEIIVTALGTYTSMDPNATKITMMGGGGSHDFLNQFGIKDGKVLSNNGKNQVVYTEDSAQLNTLLNTTDVLFISNNKPFDKTTQKTIFTKINEGMPMMIYHPSTWYNWKDWPAYNKELVGGGSTSHEELQEFDVIIKKPNHPILKGVPRKFRIFDELYRWKKDPEGTEIEVLAIGRGIKSGEEYPVLWIVKHPKAKIVSNTLGHDERAHNLPAYEKILRNTLEWIK